MRAGMRNDFFAERNELRGRLVRLAAVDYPGTDFEVRRLAVRIDVVDGRQKAKFPDCGLVRVFVKRVVPCPGKAPRQRITRKGVGVSRVQDRGVDDLSVLFGRGVFGARPFRFYIRIINVSCLAAEPFDVLLFRNYSGKKIRKKIFLRRPVHGLCGPFCIEGE